jgi:hypothetical protein
MSKTPYISEQEAYDAYVADCHSRPGVYVSEFNFGEWRVMGRPRGMDKNAGNWPTPWPSEEL